MTYKKVIIVKPAYYEDECFTGFEGFLSEIPNEYEYGSVRIDYACKTLFIYVDFNGYVEYSKVISTLF